MLTFSSSFPRDLSLGWEFEGKALIIPSKHHPFQPLILLIHLLERGVELGGLFAELLFFVVFALCVAELFEHQLLAVEVHRLHEQGGVGLIAEEAEELEDHLVIGDAREAGLAGGLDADGKLDGPELAAVELPEQLAADQQRLWLAV